MGSAAISLPWFLFAFNLLAVSEVSGFGSSCNFRCHSMPTLLDYMYPSGCYCHSTCGGKLRCCADKARLCGSRHGGSGSQDCLVPRRVWRATVVGGEKVFYRRGDSITYECPYHYEIEGSPTRTCLGSNIWSPGPPRCDYVTFVCSPPRIRDGDYSTKKKHYKTGDTIRITCNTGYLLEGNSFLRCSLNRWDHFTPSCIRNRCATITYCSKDATCKNYQYYAKCICNEGFEGDGWTCKPIPCFKHNCKARANEVCVDSGNGDGNYACECKEGYMREGGSCTVDPCFENDCHENAGCSVDDQGNPKCTCNDGFIGNGTFCEEVQCIPSEVYGEDVPGLCSECQEICCNSTKLRECRICIHVQRNGGEVCGEEGLSRVPTVCTDKKCHENEGGFTVETPGNVHCLDEKGMIKENMNCCWIGE